MAEYSLTCPIFCPVGLRTGPIGSAVSLTDKGQRGLDGNLPDALAAKAWVSVRNAAGELKPFLPALEKLTVLWMKPVLSPAGPTGYRAGSQTPVPGVPICVAPPLN